MLNKKSIAKWLGLASLPACLILPSVLLSTPVLALNSSGTQAAPIAEIAHLEDYECADYLKSMHKTLESKFEKDHKSAKDWALIGFIIKRDGTIINAQVSNSTGNEKFNSEALRIVSTAKLPPLPADVPAEVKSYHPFNYARAIKGEHRPGASRPHQMAGPQANSRTTEEAENTTNGLGDYMVTFLRRSNLISDENDTPNLRALVNIIGNCVYIIWILFVYSFLFGALPLFFVAGPVWWIHRLLLGRFPS